jgi:hypothetical protein
MENYHWEKFHDWLIGSIIIDWVDAIIRIRLSQKKDSEIEIIDFRNISISRLLPWGKSQHINNIKCEKNIQDNWELEIELQSGDILKFEGGQIGLNE